MKIQGPLLSQRASGTVAEVLTFSKRGSGQQARYQRKQNDVFTTKRTTQRNLFLAAVSHWNFRDFGIADYGFSLYGVGKTQFEKAGTARHITGYDFFIRDYLIVGD